MSDDEERIRLELEAAYDLAVRNRGHAQQMNSTPETLAYYRKAVREEDAARTALDKFLTPSNRVAVERPYQN